MTGEMIFVSILILAMLTLLLFEVIRADFVVFLFLVIFLITGVISTNDALAGFSNEGVMTIVVLFIVASAIQKHGVIENLIYKMLGKNKNERSAIIKFTAPVGIASGFLNNTPIVVTLTPIIKNWAIKNGFSPSKFLIPLSYVTIMGGTLTLIGTSTNLIVHGLLLGEGLEGFRFFEFSIVGIVILSVGMIYLATIGYNLLPDTLGAMEKIDSETKEFLAEAYILTDFELVNKTVLEVTKDALKGIYIVDIFRDKKRLPEVTANTRLRAGDRIVFSATLDTIGVVKQVKGLSIRTGSELTLDALQNENTVLVEAVISHNSSLLNKTLKTSNFKSRFNAGVIAIHRNNKRINSKVGEIVLKAGDTLLLLAHNDFIDKNKFTDDFYVVTAVKTPEEFLQNQKQGWFVIGLMGLMIGFVTLGVLSMFKAMLLLVIILFMLKLISIQDVTGAIQFDVILLIASAFGVGKAITNSGLADFLATHLVDIVKPLGILGLLVVIYIITNIFTELITNSAAAVLMFPIALEMAHLMNTDYLGFVITVTIAASSSFMTPIGYQTNLIVYGPGGYKFSDYIKVGAPLSFLIMIVSVSIIYTVWF
ncbi:SLC13 family permease [Phocicoccus pinnipedialis]|uniref:Sodium-dependent dicarboxylate transporter SdcS n=1 Tax=Phocicoccus pinnipedialis TaxID=110845 RepID=A0A6V7RJG4_9BACL|nr:SLC13 family permease [Jeotgalicoccus pinnipedialis]MBP1938972.1 di/tricarboxylate transporter [Jeotgalicoccus pinnipedialis]CAD2077350.1 Sodium-dependent dicarboxylate transporter SdcS [Jeotgalicoccus pinnipedialis]